MNYPILASADDIRAALRPSDHVGDLYIEPAASIDVLFEQLSYLDTHAPQSCSPECPDCMRLKRVGTLLLQPFRSRKRAN